MGLTIMRRGSNCAPGETRYALHERFTALPFETLMQMNGAELLRVGKRGVKASS